MSTARCSLDPLLRLAPSYPTCVPLSHDDRSVRLSRIAGRCLLMTTLSGSCDFGCLISMRDKERMLGRKAATEAAIVAASKRRIEIVGVRRPAYDAAFRARVVEASLALGMRARDLARRQDIYVSLI